MPRRSSPSSPAFPGHPLGFLGPSRLSDLVGPELGLLACCLAAVFLPACLPACTPARLPGLPARLTCLLACLPAWPACLSGLPALPA